jgi:hypothetical protein
MGFLDAAYGLVFPHRERGIDHVDMRGLLCKINLTAKN